MRVKENELRAAIRGARDEADVIRYRRAGDGRRWRIICEEVALERISSTFARDIVRFAGMPALAAVLTRPDVPIAVRDAVLDAVVADVLEEPEDPRVDTLLGVVALAPERRQAIAARLAAIVAEGVFEGLGVWRAAPIAEVYLQIEDDIDEGTLVRMLAAYRTSIRLARAIAFHPAAGRRVWRAIANQPDTEEGSRAVILAETPAVEDASIRRLIVANSPSKVHLRLVPFTSGDECREIVARLLKSSTAATIAVLEGLSAEQLAELPRTLLPRCSNTRTATSARRRSRCSAGCLTRTCTLLRSCTCGSARCAKPASDVSLRGLQA